MCGRVLLPSPSQQETNPVCYLAADGQPNTFAQLTLGGMPAGFTVTNGAYAAWSAAYPSTMPPNAICQVRLFDSLGLLPSHLQSTNWDLVAYILNHKQGTPDDIQGAIWHFVGGPVTPGDPRFSPPSATTLDIIADALANGEGYTPAQSGQLAAVILDAGTGSPIIIEAMPTPDRPPVAGADAFSTTRDIPLPLALPQLTGNDSDPDGDALAFVDVSTNSVRGGQITFDGTNIVYTPPPGFEGTDSFHYGLAAGPCGTAIGSVTITVSRAPNQPPLAGTLLATTPMNTPLTIPLVNILALAIDPDGDALVLVGISPDSTAGGLAVLAATNALYFPPLDYLGADSFTFIVQDPSGARATGMVSIAVIAAPMAMTEEAPVHNTQTGLFEQRVTVSNDGLMALAAFRLNITGLPTNVVVWNASGTNAGAPYLQYNRALNPGESVTLRIEYYVPDRRPFHPTITLMPVMPSAPKPANGGGGVAINRCFMDTRLPGEPRYVIEFSSTPGHIYTIIYSDDMNVWKTALPAVTATANSTQWYDDGPPKTDSKPAEKGTRFYRVIQSP